VCKEGKVCQEGVCGEEGRKTRKWKRGDRARFFFGFSFFFFLPYSAFGKNRRWIGSLNDYLLSGMAVVDGMMACNLPVGFER
jgi:hypothetical protein